MKVVIVEDNYSALQDLEHLLQKNFPSLKVVGNAGNFDDAVDLLKKHTPVIVFMDVELIGDKNGFDVLKEVNLPETFVIFVSNHKEQMYEAFRLGYFNMEYLPKPIDQNEFLKVVQKAVEAKTRPATAGHELLILPVPQNNDKIFISLEDISYIEGDGTVCIVHLKNSRTINATRSLSYFIEWLPRFPKYLFRVHRSYIINPGAVIRFQPSDRTLKMSNEREIPVSQTYLEGFKQFMGLH